MDIGKIGVIAQAIMIIVLDLDLVKVGGIVLGNIEGDPYQ